MRRRACLYPAWLRLWHWANALLFLSLVLTGFRLHFVELPVSLMSFETAVMVHNTAGLFIVFLYLFYLFLNIATGNVRHYLPRLRGLYQGLKLQAAFYGGGIFRGEREPFPPRLKCKFNPLQQITYLGAAFVGLPILIGTGLAYMFPQSFVGTLLGSTGIVTVAIAHYVMGVLMTVFLIGHIYLGFAGATLTSEFRKMASGWLDVEDEGSL
jgi:thiosulfate reductase cytochrome b subunit